MDHEELGEAVPPNRARSAYVWLKIKNDTPKTPANFGRSKPMIDIRQGTL